MALLSDVSLENANSMIARTRYFIDETSEKNFPTNSLLMSINQAQLIVVLEMTKLDAGFFEVSAELNPNGSPAGTVSGIQEYTLPSDFLSFKRVEDASSGAPIDPMDLNERYTAPQAITGGAIPIASMQPVGFYVTGNSIGFVPVPQGNYRVRMVYVQRPAFLVNGTDVPVIPYEWRDMCCMRAALEALGKDETDNGWLGSLYTQAKTLLEQTITERQHQMPKSVTRTGQSW